MDYEKFASAIESKTAERRSKREDLQARVKTARDALNAAEYKAQHSGTPSRYKAEKQACNKAFQELQAREMELNEFNSRGYLFTYDELVSADNMLSTSYQKEQDGLEKTLKDYLQALQNRLLPLSQKFEEHRKTGNAALKMMASETEPDLDYSSNPEFRSMSLNFEDIPGLDSNDDNVVENVLKMIDAVLNDRHFSITVDNNN